MLARWAPFELLDRDFGDLVRRAFGDLPSQLGALGQATRTWLPAVDVFAEDGDLHVRLEAPGLDPEKDVDIEVVEGRLTIRGQRHREEAAEEKGYWRREMAYGHFERSIMLPQGVDASRVRATYDAGILDVAVPLPQEQSKKIKVEIGPATTHKELKQG